MYIKSKHAFNVTESNYQTLCILPMGMQANEKHGIYIHTSRLQSLAYSVFGYEEVVIEDCKGKVWRTDTATFNLWKAQYSDQPFDNLDDFIDSILSNV